jgi:inward rectifier potassium channel
MTSEVQDALAPPPRYPRLGGGPASPLVILGHGKDGWRDAYHYLLVMPLPLFFAVMGGGFVAINLIFGTAYFFIGGIGAPPGDFASCFFFSVQTLNTIGYGVLAPKTLPANIVVTLEAFVGLFNLAIATGLLFARISRPTARVMFSDKAVVTDYNGVPTLIFRAANRRRNRIVEAEVSVSLLRDVQTLEGDTVRTFHTLEPIRPKTPVFYLSWQIMHRIDAQSPLARETPESFTASRDEIVVVLKGLDETFGQTVHARTSYTPDEIVWGRRLADIFIRRPDGVTVIDYTHFHEIV